MSKWKQPNEHSVVIDDENGYLGAAEGSLAARDLVANHNADIDALQAKLDAATQPGIVWNYDMDDAPKDGTRVLVVETWGGGRIHIATWFQHQEAWITDDETFIGVEHIIAWAPLNWPEGTP